MRMREKNFDQRSLLTVSHPPTSPDLAPADLWLFADIKISLATHLFNDVDELIEAVIMILNEIPSSELPSVFNHWIERVKSVFAITGNS
jgi:hypothetical protein